MSEDRCIHDMEPGTCSLCKRAVIPAVSQATLNFAAIENAVNELAANGEFRTKDVAHHELVRAAHAGQCDNPRFDQHIGAYLTDAIGRLRIEQVSPKGQSNARWRRRT